MRKTTLLVLGALMALPALARDIEYSYEGQTLTYTVISEEDKTVGTKAGSTSYVAGNKVTGELVIPSTVVDSENVSYTVTSIGAYAFCYCNGLTSVTIPESVISIGDYVFSGCQKLSTIIVADENTNYCSQEGVLFSKDKTTLHCFPAGKNVKEYSIPNTVTVIGKSTFFFCSSLTSVTIPESVKEIEMHAFYRCGGLTSVTFPNSVTSIGAYAFHGCTGLSSLVIPESVTHIGGTAFGYCSALTSVILPESLYLLGPYAFDKCTGLTAVYYAAKSPISADPWIFDVYESATLYVPTEAVERCKKIDPWKNFKSIEAFDFAGVEEVCDDIDMESPYEVFNMQGVAVGNSIDGLPSGIYVIRQGKAAKKIAIK